MNRLANRILIGACAAGAAFAIACGSGSTPSGDTADAVATDVPADTLADAANDSVGPDARDTVAGDATDDTIIPPTCAELIASHDMMRLLPDEGRIVVHLNAAFDGQALWLGWTSFSDQTGFGTIRAARMACDGTFLVPPFDVDPDNAGNSYEAEIAIAGGNVMIAWHQDYQGYYTLRAGQLPGVAVDLPSPERTWNADAPELRIAREAPEPTPDAIDADVQPPDVHEPDAVEPDAASDAFATDTADAAADTATADAVADVTADIPVFPNDNMRVYYRSFKLDGTPIMPAAVRFMPVTDDGEPPLVNNWIPKIAALPDGRFVIASAWACPGNYGFQAVAQRFNADGTKHGGLIRPWPMDRHDQTYSDIAVDPDGNILMVWGDTEFIDDVQQKTRIASVTIPPDATEPIEDSPVFLDALSVPGRTGDNPSIAVTPANIAFTAWLTDESLSNIVVAAQTAGRAASGTAKFGDASWYDTYPMMVAGPGGAAMVWYKWTNTKDSVTDKYPPTEVRFTKLAWNGTGDITGIGDPMTVNPSTDSDVHDAVQYYEPVVVDVGGGNYFVMWTDSYCDPCAQPATTGPDATAAVEAVWHYPTYARFIKP